jgi:nitrogen regulatory protein P-II 1
MRKIEAIVREEKMHDVIDALTSAGITGITVYQVMGCGTQHGCTTLVRGKEVTTQILPKIKFEIVVSDEKWEEVVINTIMQAANTGHYGDGKIFAYDLDTVIRIRTGERDYDAINSSKVKE